MVDTTDSAMLEIVSLPNGRYTVQPVGGAAPVGADGEFATLAEAEEWMFMQTQQMDSRANDLTVMKPGGGQGLL